MGSCISTCCCDVMCCCGPTRKCKYCGKTRTTLSEFQHQPLPVVFQKIRPLDCMLFKCGSCSSAFIRRVQGRALGHGEFSHCGIVVDASLMPILKDGRPAPPNKLYLLEATQGVTAPDSATGKVMTGVQVRDLAEVIEEYRHTSGGAVAWLPLKDNPLFSDSPISNEIPFILARYYHDIIHKDYEYAHLSHLLLAVSDRPFKHATDQTYFCSELVAAVYQRIKLFEEKLDCETIAPVEFLCNGLIKAPRFEQPVVITL